MREIERYLDEIMDAADLAARDGRRVRRELADHLAEVLELGRSRGVPDEEIMTMVKKEFGEPRELGEMIARAKGRFRTYLKKQARAIPINIAVAVVLALIIRRTMLQRFRVVTDALAPTVQKGSSVLVNKLAREFSRDDIIVYWEGERSMVGRVKDIEANGKVTVARNGEEDRSVDVEAIRGRAFFLFSRI